MLCRFCSSKYTSTLSSRSIRVILRQSQRVPGEAADGFDDDHVHLATLALANELVEFIPLFHTGAGDTLIGVNARQLPAGFPVDAVRVITHLRFVSY